MKYLFLLWILTLSINTYGHDITSKMPTPLSVSWLGTACKATSDEAKGFCDGAIELAYSSHGNWCVPSDVTRGEVTRVIKREVIAAENGKYSHIYDFYDLITLPAHSFIWSVIDKKWPCNETR